MRQERGERDLKGVVNESCQSTIFKYVSECRQNLLEWVHWKG